MAVLEGPAQLVLPNGYITVTEAARQKGVNTEALRGWLRYNNIHVVRVGRTVLVRANELEKYNPR